ncbi:MAG: hypothetical protein UW92_C0045G0007 [Candidatus Jorgensenbacteria bacterium GW2011_GWA2_45_13]|uniref:Uncharacterized protein n=1 Tax=Candidatus Jorgensenbacteria bacterium GW2011_GWA2_45_13 TaxID=1618662 RepID=A0A0G1NAC8_9BACT|nr:MAG: hypothetical protein UW92_C0045G0007 [Candidatus Jorgensenbacteria bacterium GW2011_GWA2_45_13]
MEHVDRRVVCNDKDGFVFVFLFHLSHKIIQPCTQIGEIFSVRRTFFELFGTRNVIMFILFIRLSVVLAHIEFAQSFIEINPWKSKYLAHNLCRLLCTSNV